MHKNNNLLNVVIQGLGFVGAATMVAVTNAKNSENEYIYNTVGLDLNSEQGNARIRDLNNGVFPFPTNDSLLIKITKSIYLDGRLKATTDNSVIETADILIVNINLDISFEQNGQSINFSDFKKAIVTIGQKIKEEALVIIETTVPPGTCTYIIKPIIETECRKRGIRPERVFIAHSYERVMPGENYLDSIVNYWRVYSGITKEAADKCESFFMNIINTADYPLTRLKNTNSSETGKLLENSYRAVNIAFIEEWGRFAEEANVDLYEVIDSIRQRPTHSDIRQPGFGVGGYCLTKDPLFAKIAARDILDLDGHDFPFSSKAVKVNAEMPLVTLNKIIRFFNGDIRGKKILLMGVTYRQDVGDTRFSPSEIFYNKAKAKGAEITAHDPMVKYWEEIGLDVLNDLPDLNDFSVVLFTVPHKSFKEINLEDWISSNNILIFDANNVLTKKQVTVINNNNYNYLSIGRG